MDYRRELQNLKPWDEVQNICADNPLTISGKISTSYQFIHTAGHGYLVVPRSDKNAEVARKICRYGFIGKLAYYLEEDCEYNEFMKAVGIF